MQFQVKLKVGSYLYPVLVEPEGAKLKLRFEYNVELIEEVKTIFSNPRWDKENKEWSIPNNRRNLFQLKYAAGANPYEFYDKPLVGYNPTREECKEHQKEMTAHILQRMQCLLACEMRTGKTLAAIEAIEKSGVTDCWWVGPKSALYGVQLEFMKWKSKVTPKFFTYDSLKKEVENWEKGRKTPQFVVFDEISRCKNPIAQRSQAAYILSNQIRDDWNEKAYVVGMSGSPSPKDPSDWYWLCEICCPGFLKEGSIQKFKDRLAIIERRNNSITGGAYPHLVTWKDNEAKCGRCGELPDHRNHDHALGGHTHIPSKNEVAYLARRMSGLVLVKFKKDCLKDLPDIVYEQVQLKATPDMMRAASIINKNAPLAVTALTLQRELSDGFQYQDIEDGYQICPGCFGEKVITGWKEDGTTEDIPCPNCNATGESVRYKRHTKEIPTPKEAALRSYLDQHGECGRLVVYAGFTGSVERCVRIVKEQQWNWIRVDGTGWSSNLTGTGSELLAKFANPKEYEKICFVAQPSSGGMGIDLSASPTTIFYSNDFNGESRIQSVHRIHSLGMNIAKGATIIDFLCLPADLLVLTNLNKKIRLQDMTMGVIREEIEKIKFTTIREF